MLLIRNWWQTMFTSCTLFNKPHMKFVAAVQSGASWDMQETHSAHTAGCDKLHVHREQTRCLQ